MATVAAWLYSVKRPVSEILSQLQGSPALESQPRAAHRRAGWAGGAITATLQPSPTALST